MPSITITISDSNDRRGARVATDGEHPHIGRTLTPAEALAMDLLRICNRQASQVLYGAEHVPLVNLADELLRPEGLGFACTPEVRDRARIARGLPPVEAHKRNDL